jgi:hypothetical protein
MLLENAAFWAAFHFWPTNDPNLKPSPLRKIPDPQRIIGIESCRARLELAINDKLETAAEKPNLMGKLRKHPS